VTQAHLEVALRLRDLRHAGRKAGTMAPRATPRTGRIQAWIIRWQKRAEPCRLRQGLQQGPPKARISQDRFAIGGGDRGGRGRRCAHAAVTPAQVHQTGLLPGPGTAEVFPIKAMKKGKQGVQGHGRLRLPALVAPSRAGSVGQDSGARTRAAHTMELGSGSGRSARSLRLGGASALLIYWTFTAVKLVLSARGIKPR